MAAQVTSVKHATKCFAFFGLLQATLRHRSACPRKLIEDGDDSYDLITVIAHPFGLAHERLAYYHNGLERRLTDVHGEVVKAVLI